MNAQKMIGGKIERIDALSKVMGKSKYANDLKFENMIYGKILRSPFPRARIKEIDIANVRDLPGIVVLTARDIPGENAVGVIIKDQPILVDKEVRFVGEPVVLVGGDSEEIAEKAIELIKVTYEPLEAIFNPIKAMGENAPEIHPGGNIASYMKVRKGDTKKGFKEADIVIEGVYKTQRVEHAYLEPETAVAKLEDDGRITVWASTQHTHHDREEVARMLGLSLNRVRIIQTTPLNPETGQGSPQATYSFTGSVAEVKVDTETGKVEILKLINIVDVGKAINPLGVEGQIEGGGSMGIGYALMEEIKAEEGVIKNPNFTDYLIPTSMDVNQLLSEIVEEKEPSGPYGAKGVGEPAVNPVASAILNAIYDAAEVRITELPAVPEKVFKALKTVSKRKRSEKNRKIKGII